MCGSVLPQFPGLHLSAGSLQPLGFHLSAAFVQPFGSYPYTEPSKPLSFHLFAVRQKQVAHLSPNSSWCLLETEPWEERSSLCWCLSFVCMDLWASGQFDGLGRVSGFWGIREFTHYVKCIKAASICCMVALTASIFCSTYVNRYVCASSLMVESWLFCIDPWAGLWTRAEVPDSC